MSDGGMIRAARPRLVALGAALALVADRAGAGRRRPGGGGGVDHLPHRLGHELADRHGGAVQRRHRDVRGQHHGGGQPMGRRRHP